LYWLFWGRKFHPVKNNRNLGIWFTLTRKYYEPDGLRITYPKSQVSLGFRSRFHHDVYEQEERQLARKYIRATDRVLELGACIGVVSCIVHRLLEPGTTHVVVEANPFLIPTIYKNKELNSLDFVVEHCMVSQKRLNTFYVQNVIVGGTAVCKTERSVTVPGRSLDELWTMYGGFDTFIVDIEGGEYDLFLENLELVRQFRLVIMEQHEFILKKEKTEAIRNALRESGFELVETMDCTEVWLNQTRS